MSSGLRVAVIGAGVFGTSAARSLAGRGCDVTLFERAKVPAPDASGTDISKAIRLEYGAATPRYAPLVLESMDAWRSLEAETERALYDECGVLLLAGALGEDCFERTSQRHLAALGIDVTLTDAEAAARRWPAFRWAGHEGALFNPRGGWLAAADCVRALADAAVAAGVTLVEDAAVDDVSEGELRAGGETLRFDAILVCAGPWVRRLLPSVPVKVTRQHIAHFRPTTTPALPVWGHEFSRADERGVWYGFPASDGVVKVAHHDRGDEVDPDAERSAPADFAEEARAFVREHLPGLDADAPLQTRACLYSNGPSGDVVIDQVAPRLFVAGCGSGHGFKLGPAVGARAARLVVEGETDFPLDAERDEVW